MKGPISTIGHLDGRDLRLNALSTLETYQTGPDDYETLHSGKPAPGPEFRDEGLKLVGALTPALVKAHIFMRLAIGSRPVTDAGSVFRFAILVLKSQDHRHERFF
jgi:hypothetical protein